MTFPFSQKLSVWFAYFTAAAGAILATVLMTWPLAYSITDHVLEAIYYWDAYCNTMILGSRVDAALGRSPLSLYDNYFFAPLPNSIVFNENHFGLSLIFLPYYLLSRNPILAYNMTLMSSLALSVFMTHLLVYRLTKDRLAGFVAGIAFAFCPYVLFEVGRIQLVATQWIPTLFLLLHRAIEQRKCRDIAGFWAVYLLQIGTCLYYAMFLIPLLGTTAILLSIKHRPTRAFTLQVAAGGLVAAAVALAMVYPYFSTRQLFELERSLDFAASYDGKLSFFGNVFPTNRSLTALHHVATERGAHEEIAFPGFTMAGLAALVIIRPWLKRPPLFGSLRAALGPLWLVALSVSSALLTHSVLVGLLVLFAGYFWLYRARRPASFGLREIYLVVGAVSLLMFLGLYPLEFRGEKVRGLYYYFHTYFPGFNGIRKVSRQAIMVTFVLTVLAGLGAHSLFVRQQTRAKRYGVFCLLLGGLAFELRTFPHPLHQVWSDETIPPAYAFMRTLPATDIIASHPQNQGRQTFVGDAGMAYHNYLALYHKHRFANGQSSWLPQVTELVRRSLEQLPKENAARLLRQVGVQHLYLRGSDLPSKQAGLIADLSQQPAIYEKVYGDAGDAVFSLVTKPNHEGPELLDEPRLPETASLLPLSALTPRSAIQKHRLKFAIDGDLNTHWSTRVSQARGHYFEIILDRARSVIALEIENPSREMYLPLSYSLSGSTKGEKLRPLLQQPDLRLFRDQIFAPKGFVYRIVLPRAAFVDRIRLSIGTPMPGYDFVIHELRLYEDSASSPPNE